MPSDSFAINTLNISNNFTTNLFKMHEGDLLFGSIRPYLHKAGLAPVDGYVAGTIHSYTAKNDYDYNLLLLTLCSIDVFNYAVNVSGGTKMPVVTSENLLEYKFPYSKQVSYEFSKLDIKNSDYVTLDNAERDAFLNAINANEEPSKELLDLFK